MDWINDLFSSAGSELIAVILGGVLATTGGFLGTMYEERRDQRRQGRHIRQVLMDAIRTAQTVYSAVLTNPDNLWDPGLYLVMNSLRNEYEIYERNREQMVYLEDEELRVAVTTFMIRLVLFVDGFADDQSILNDIEDAMEDAERDCDNEKLERLKEREARQLKFREDRRLAIDEVISEAPDLLARLEKGAHE